MELTNRENSEEVIFDDFKEIKVVGEYLLSECIIFLMWPTYNKAQEQKITLSACICFCNKEIIYCCYC